MGAESIQEFEIEILVKKKIKASVSCIITPSLEEIKDQYGSIVDEVISEEVISVLSATPITKEEPEED